jgi:hypothetical protein
MKVTTGNWKEVWRDMKESGILDTTYNENGGLQSATTNKGKRYEFSPDVIKQLIESWAMEVKLGRRVEKN